MKRIVAIEARYAVALDVALDRLMEQIEANDVPMFAQDDQPGHILITIERPEPALQLLRRGAA